MKQRQCETMGLKFTVDVPDNSAEFNKLAKAPEGQDFANDEAVKNVLYRSTFADVRGFLVDKAEELTKKGRKTKDHPKGNKYKEEQKDEAGNVVAKAGDPIQVYDETEEEYLSRLAADDGKTLEAMWQPVLDELMKLKDEQGVNVIRFDPSQSERKAPSATGPTKVDFAMADGLIAAPIEKFNIALGRIKSLINEEIDPEKARADRAFLAGYTRKYRIEMSKADSLLK